MTQDGLIETGGFDVLEPPVAERGDYFRVIGLLATLCQAAPTDPRIAVIPGEPPSKQRPRARVQTTRAGKAYVQAYTPAETRKAEQRLAWQMRPLGHHPAGMLAVAILFYRRTRQRVDIDNLQKAALDAATLAGVWADDSQVSAIACIRQVDNQAPRLVMAIAPIPTNQLELPA
jgi:crossover junction endodeoxyribonuclease RusA